MPRKALVLRKVALSEAQAAYGWLASQDTAAGEAFIGELDEAMELIEKFPNVGVPYSSGTRRYVMKRFPFTLVYRERPRTIQVVAVAHARRKPGYWKSE